MELAGLIKRHRILKARVTTMERFINTHLEGVQNITPQTLNSLKLRITNFEDIIHNFEEVQAEIEVHQDDPEFIDINERELFQTRYIGILGRAKYFIEKNASESESTTHDNNPSRQMALKLPTIDLPTFNGNYTKYREFHDVFKALVDSHPDASDAEKLCYLKMSVKGESAVLLSSFDTTAANYKLAFELLDDRYDNVRLTVHNHVKQLLNLESVTKESHLALRRVIDTSE